MIITKLPTVAIGQLDNNQDRAMLLPGGEGMQYHSYQEHLLYIIGYKLIDHSLMMDACMVLPQYGLSQLHWYAVS